MARPIAMRIRSDEIARELVGMVKEDCLVPLALKLYRVGAIESAVTPDNTKKEVLRDLFPAVFVRPSGADYTSNVGNQTRFDVVDRFRIAYAVPIAAEKDPLIEGLDGLRLIADALAKDASLFELSQRIGNDQIIASLPEATEFDPAEDAFLDFQIPVKVVVLRWNVTWTT